jgi:hypothetical protein
MDCISKFSLNVLKEGKGKERKGKERKGKERKGKERKGKERRETYKIAR